MCVVQYGPVKDRIVQRLQTEFKVYLFIFWHEDRDMNLNSIRIKLTSNFAALICKIILISHFVRRGGYYYE